MQLNPFHKNFALNRYIRLRRRYEIMAKAKPIVISNKFLHRARLDVCAKHAYARLIGQSPHLEWAIKVYTSCLMAVNGGREAKPTKHNVDDFVRHFHVVLQSIKHDGWRADKEGIPIAPEDKFLILNGAHRLAACILYRVTPIFYTNNKKSWRPLYTQSTLRASGLPVEILDYIIMEYVRLVDTARIGMIWPGASTHAQQIKLVYEKHGCEIIYEKSIPITSARAPFNIIRQVYAFEEWLDTGGKHSEDAYVKAENCFSDETPLHVLVLRADQPEMITRAKQEVRKITGMGHSATHTTDYYDDTLRVAKLFFNQNSIEWATSAALMETPKFKARLYAYRKVVGESDEFAIHGSSVLQAWGIREADDLDYISTDLRPLFSRRDISLDNKKAEYGSASLNNLLFDPLNYFYFNGVKFVTLNAVLEMKRARGEAKDMRDIEIASR